MNVVRVTMLQASPHVTHFTSALNFGEGQLAIYASLIGAMAFARAVDDPALSKQILQAVAASL